MILLDTNAVIWLEQRHPRVASLAKRPGSLYVSPASVLELQYLVEAGRIRIASGGVGALVADERWLVDDPPAVAWFEAACDVGWTRDPFDRLLVAHAQVRGWRLATGDRALLARLPASRRIEV